MKVLKTIFLLFITIEACQPYKNSFFFEKTENSFTKTILYGFNDEFVISFLILSTGVPTSYIIGINDASSATIFSVDTLEESLNIAVYGKSQNIKTIAYTWSSIVISQYFINDNNTYDISLIVNGTVQYSNISIQPSMFTDVSLYTFEACGYENISCNFGSIRNFSVNSTTQVIWSQWNEWSQCYASGVTTRTRKCSENQWFTCSGNSTEIKTCTYLNEAFWAQWNKWVNSNSSYIYIKKTRECNNSTTCNRCYGINFKEEKISAVWSQWSEWSLYNNSYGFMNRTRECNIFKSSTISMEKETFLSKGSLIATLMLYKEHTVYFEINPTALNKSVLENNIFSLTNGIDINHRCQILSVFLNQANGTLLILFGLNKTDYNVSTTPIQIGNWTSVKIFQKLSAEKYAYSIELNGQKIFNFTNQDPKDFSNVTVFVSNPNNDVQTGYIKNLNITNYIPVWVQSSNWSGLFGSYKEANKTTECIKMCSGENLEFAFWTSWSNWSICNDTYGFMHRSRSCNVSNSMTQCNGNSFDAMECYAIWSQWSIWSSCNATNGIINRTRECNISYVTGKCHGDSLDVMKCNEKWASWSECSVTCGLGKRSRLSLQSIYAKVMVESCVLVHCPEDGMWGDWNNPQCSKTCGSELIVHNRTCNKPPPSFNGRECIGASSYNEECNTDMICPVNGNWTMWSSWSLCSQPCNGGIKSRFRTCSNPTPRFGGWNCVGNVEEFENCTVQNCIIVNLNMAVNFIDEDYNDWKFQPKEIIVKIHDAIAKLYMSRNINKNFNVVIHTIEYWS